MSTITETLTPPADYQSRHSQIFPSLQSILWFIRQNRKELIEAGALVQLAGRNLFVEERLQDTLLTIGKRSAQRYAQ